MWITKNKGGRKKMQEAVLSGIILTTVEICQTKSGTLHSSIGKCFGIMRWCCVGVAMVLRSCCVGVALVLRMC